MLCIHTSLLSGAASVVYQRNIDIPRLIVASEGLFEIVEACRELLDEAAGDEAVGEISEALSIGSESLLLELDEGFLESDLEKVPTEITEVRYSISSDRKAPVGSISMIFRQSYRTLSVSGSDLTQVEVAVDQIRTSLKKLAYRKLGNAPNSGADEGTDAAPAPVPAQQTFKETRSFRPVRASHKDLFELIGRIRELVSTANAETKSEGLENLTMEGGRSALTLEMGFDLDAMGLSPSLSTDVRYTYRNSQSPISGVVVAINDSFRSLSVEGLSEAQVSALATAVDQGVQDITVPIGGFRARAIGGAILWLVGMLLILAVPALESKKSKNVRLKFVVGALGIALILSIWIVPWADWLAGTVVRSDDQSFLERNGPIFTLLALLVTVGGIAWGFASWVIKIKPAETPAAKASVGETKDAGTRVDNKAKQALKRPKKAVKQTAKKGAKKSGATRNPNSR